MKTLTLTISQFNTFIKNILDSEEFLSNIAIIGEVTNFKVSGGNAFFDLKDETAMISCIKFGVSELNIKNGDRVTVNGRVNFYVKTGRISFVVSKVSVYGMGDLYQQFLLLKEKLETEGLFREEIKKPIPKFAKKLGVVTSETGAVIRDIINVTRSKNPYTDIVVYPSKVQGEGAENELASGIKYFNTRTDIDTIIIARGGGSLEDLAPFNTEKIVRAIVESNLPIISAVGHETDFTLCDFASDLRVPTPSVAAEVAVFSFYEQMEALRQISDRNSYLLGKIIADRKQNLILMSNSIIDKLRLKLSEHNSKLKVVSADIENKLNFFVKDKKSKFESVLAELSKQNPLEILSRGYTLIEKNKIKINSAQSLNKNDEVTLYFKDGIASAKIMEIELKGDKYGIWKSLW